MAINPPVLPNGLPAPVNGEYMVLSRNDIEAEIALENGTRYKGKGDLYLTTARIVFVNRKGGNMQSFDVPLALMSRERFKQPIFGANYINGKVEPLYGLIPCPAEFKFWFMSGGTGTFLPLFYNTTDQIRKRRDQGHAGPDPRFIQCVAAGQLRNVAYVDPNDPSTIFVQQPQQVNTQAQQGVNYYFPGAQIPPAQAPPNQGQYQPNAPPQQYIPNVLPQQYPPNIQPQQYPPNAPPQQYPPQQYPPQQLAPQQYPQPSAPSQYQAASEYQSPQYPQNYPPQR